MRLANIYKAIAHLALFAVPSVLYAQANDISGLMQIGGNLLNTIIPIFVGGAVVVFLFGVLKFMQAGDDANKIADGRQYMIYSIVAIFVMISIFGLVGLLSSTVNLDNGMVTIPQF